jgi:hypothetical protein
LQVRFTKRYSHGLTFLGNYNLSSKKTQNGCRYYGNCSLDYYSPGLTQNTVGSVAYDLPIPTGNSRLMKGLLGGWQLGGTVSGASGGYLSIGDYNCNQWDFSSANGCDANYIGGSVYSSAKGGAAFQGGSQIGVNWLNPSAFVRAGQIVVNGAVTTAPGVGDRLFLGNAIVGIAKGPASFMINGSLNKDFAITERFKLNYRLEAFNAMNHTVLNAPGNTTVQPDMSHFGQITSAWNPRQIQMSARIQF